MRAYVQPPAPRRLLLLGDLHGDLLTLWDLLRSLGVDPAQPHLPAGTLLVHLGDAIDCSQRHRLPDLLCGLDGSAAALRPEAALGPWSGARIAAITRELEGGEQESQTAARELRSAAAPAPAADAAAAARRAALLGALLAYETLRCLAALDASPAGGGCLMLRGNHENDLLRAAPRWFAEQKRWLRALLGLPAEVWRASAALPGARHMHSLERLAEGRPLLAWLLHAPILAQVGPVLAVHGGPPARLFGAQAAGAGPATAEELCERLDAALAAGPEHPLLREGASLLAPDGPEDDPQRSPELVHGLLQLFGATTLAVGHNPFLGLPRGGWYDTAQPAVAAHLREVLRIGPEGRLLKLDTDRKRQPMGAAWVSLDLATDQLALHSGAGPSLSLGALAPNPCAATAPAAADPGLGAEGLAAEDLTELWAAADSLAGAPVLAGADLVREVAELLRAEPRCLARPLEELAAWLAGDPRAAARWHARLRALRDRADELAERIVAATAGPAQPATEDAAPRLLPFALAAHDEQIGPERFCLDAAVLGALNARGRRGLALRAARGFAEQPVLRALLGSGEPDAEDPPLAEFPLPPAEAAVGRQAAAAYAERMAQEPSALAELFPSLAQCLRTQAMRAPSGAPRAPALPGAAPDAPPTRVPQVGIRALLEANAVALGRSTGAAPGLRQAAPQPDDDGVARGLLRAELDDGAVVFAAVLPGAGGSEDLWVLANGALLAPGARLRALRWNGGPEPPLAVESPSFLPSAARCELYCGLRPEILPLLEARDFGSLARRERGSRAPWAGLPCLFTSPDPAVAAHFHGGRRVLHFSVPAAPLAALLDTEQAVSGLFTLMDTQASAGPLGSRHLFVECVFWGGEALELLWEHRVG